MGSKKGVLVKDRGDQDGTRHLELAAVTNNKIWNDSKTVVYLPQSKVDVPSQQKLACLCHPTVTQGLRMTGALPSSSNGF